jgi:hypothetical protein
MHNSIASMDSKSATAAPATPVTGTSTPDTSNR